MAFASKCGLFGLTCRSFYLGLYHCRLGLVFFFKNISRKLLDIMMGFAAGVMIAASFWSLLDPSLTYATQNGYGKWSWFPAASGFLLGGVALRLIDAVVPHLHLGNDISKAEGIQPRKKKLSKTALLFWLSPFIIFQRD